MMARASEWGEVVLRIMLLAIVASTAHARAGADFIEGRVVSGNGPEAGVWVIAETASLPTPYRKIVVTNAEGRFVIPDLPRAEYQVWVRGYGLADSTKTSATPGGATLTLQAAAAADAQDAALIYPANYWLSMLEPLDHDPGWVN